MDSLTIISNYGKELTQNIGSLTGEAIWSNRPPEPTKGIFLQWVKHEEEGQVIAIYCSDCKRTEFVVSPYAELEPWQCWKITTSCMEHLKFRVPPPVFKYDPLEERIAEYIIHRYQLRGI